MYKMMENIKINDLNEEKGKEYSAGGKGKHDVSEVVRKASACWWARGCWEACWWKIESWGMASIALRFKKELDLSCMWKTGKILSDFLWHSHSSSPVGGSKIKASKLGEG